jgi:hypothetical protein
MGGGRVKHVFPGSNTPQGFFSYYEYVISIDTAQIFLLRGESSTVKSAFMQQIGLVMLDNGYNIEYHHCATDPDSLTGLVIPQLNAALINDTSPPVIDSRYHGCVQEIITLGEYRRDGYSANKNRNAILSCTQSINSSLQHAYRMLRAAKAVYDDWEAANSEAMNYTLANEKTDAAIYKIFSSRSTAGCGKNRKLFASALTALGPVNYIDSICTAISSRYILTGLPGTGKATLLARVASTAVAKGLDIETYYCPLDPQKIEHVVIPILDTALLTSTPPHNLSVKNAVAVIDMNECLDQNIINRLEPVSAYDRTAFWEFFGKAGSYIREAKKMQDELESHYVPNINFTAIDGLRTKTLARIINCG